LFFNLPKGVFFTNENIKQNEKKEYPVLSLPEPEHFFSTKGIKTKVKENKHKATIYPNKKRIYIDKTVSQLDFFPAWVFIIAHEFGHCRYRTENYADMFATSFMLKQGFNPSQIKISYLFLFRKNESRRWYLNNVFNKINKIL